MAKGASSAALLALGGSVLAVALVLAPNVEAEGGKVRTLELTADTRDANPNANQAAYLMADMWKKLGVDVTVRELPYRRKLDVVYFDRQSCDGAACFDMSMWSITGRPERSDPDEVIYNLFHSDTADKGYNHPQYRNPDYDALASAQRVETDREKRKELVFEAQEVARDNPPYLFLVNPIESYAFRSDIWDPNSVVEQAGLGIKNFWTYINLTPVGEQKDIIINTGDNLLNLVPLAVGGSVASWATELIWDRLLRISPEGLPEPWAAESYTWLDPQTIEVTIRPDMMWHDGEPVTVDDVVFTFGEVGDMAPMYTPFIEIIDKVEVVGDRTVRMHLKRPSAGFLTSTLAKMNLTPAHIWRPLKEELQAKGQTFDDYQPDELIGSGPFKFVHWRRNAEVLLEANKEHWAAPKAERWVARIVPNLEATLGMLRNGEINFLTEYRGDYETLKQIADESGNIEIVSSVTIGTEYMSFNMNRKPQNDPAFRRAMSLAINRDLLVAAAWKGQAVKTGSIVSTVLDYWHNPAVDEDLYNLEEAKQILSDAGYTWVDGELHYPEGITDTDTVMAQ